MVILLWVTMATPPWLSTAWGFWFGLAGAGTHARVNAGADTQVEGRKGDCVRVHGFSLMPSGTKQRPEPRETTCVSASLMNV